MVVRPVGPGMTYYRLVAPSVPWSIDLLELDRTNPYLAFEMVEANDERKGGFETTSSMAARRDGPEHHVVGAINGDFFLAGGDTRNAGVSGGQVVRRPETLPATQPSIAFDANNLPLIFRLTSIGGAVLTPTDTLAITGYNESRTADALVLYNAFQGAATGTDAAGTEVLVRPVEPWAANDTVDVVVERVVVNGGNEAIPDGWAVLSATGEAGTALASLTAGAPVRVVPTLSPSLPGIKELISGRPFLIRDGQPYNLPRNDHNTARHPRTAIGFNKDASRIYLMTVDGRQSSSAGMTNFEMRDLMLRMGMDEAMGLDGGGSTTMVIRGDLVNTPSGGTSERAVGNGLLAISTAPLGPLAHIQVAPYLTSLFLGESVQISVAGADAYYNPLDLPPASLTYDVDPALGTVSATGRFTASTTRTEPGAGYVHVTYGTVSDSVRVEVRVVQQIAISPASVVTDTLLTVPFEVEATDSGGFARAVAASDIDWQVLDPTIGTITDDGVFRGHAAGATAVVAAYGATLRDTARVEVQIGAGALRLDPMDGVAGWSLESDGVEATLDAVDDPQATGGKALRLSYTLTRGAQLPALKLRARYPIYGVPDSLLMQVRTDGKRYILRYLLENPAADPLSLTVPRYVVDTAYALLAGPVARSVPAVDLSYPVALVGIEVVPPLAGVAVGETTSGTLVFDDLWVTYPGGSPSTATASGPEAEGGILRIYPNPSQSTATVAVRVACGRRVRRQVYDALGRLVRTAFDGVVAAGDREVTVAVEDLPSGVYVVRPEIGGTVGEGVTFVVAR